MQMYCFCASLLDHLGLLIIMKDKLKKIYEDFIKEKDLVKSLKELEELRVKYLGKKSEFTNILKNIGKSSESERPVFGRLSNDLRNFISKSLKDKKLEISKNELKEKLQNEKIDVTEPGKRQPLGYVHPLSLVKQSMCSIFSSMGFSVVDGPEIENDYYNFEAERDFNPNHWVALSSKQADDIDSTHSPIFHQLEGLVVDRNVTFSDLKGTLEYFIKEFYGQSTKVRFRPHNFPYTEPSAELDIECFNCKGKGCRLCKEEGYIELLGCGMVHQKVLKRCNINPEVYSGFAFGMGIERITMMKYNINDIRLFYENDIRFLKQFA